MSGWRSKYGSRYPDCAAIEAIRADMDQAYKKQREAQEEIKWLTELLNVRAAQIRDGQWPPHDPDGYTARPGEPGMFPPNPLPAGRGNYLGVDAALDLGDDPDGDNESYPY